MHSMTHDFRNERHELAAKNNKCDVIFYVVLLSTDPAFTYTKDLHLTLSHHTAI